jgi:hypothetical protein
LDAAQSERSRKRPWQRHPEVQGEAPFIRRRIVRPIFLTIIGTLGVPLGGNRVLVLRDPATGNRRKSLITPWEFEGGRYFISGSGESRWVRGLRATGEAQLKLGRHTEDLKVEELDQEEKLPVLRWYATFRIEAEDDEALRKMAPDYPVFKLTPRAAATAGAPSGGD